MNHKSAVLALMVVLAGCAVAQQKSPSKATSGVVSGSVFAITKAGDLKPARMASIYVFYIFRSAKWAEAHPEDENSAGAAWMTIRNEEMQKRLQEKETPEGMRESDSESCHKTLLLYLKALQETRKWVTDRHKDWQMITADADENGAFKARVPRSGRYLVVAYGRAGMNDAFWDNSSGSGIGIDLVVGATTTVKLSSPEDGCLSVD